jgi:hypothetical protein
VHRNPSSGVGQVGCWLAEGRGAQSRSVATQGDRHMGCSKLVRAAQDEVICARHAACERFRSNADLSPAWWKSETVRYDSSAINRLGRLGFWDWDNLSAPRHSPLSSTIFKIQGKREEALDLPSPHDSRQGDAT